MLIGRLFVFHTKNVGSIPAGRILKRVNNLTGKVLYCH